jgi:hypothetical protein
VREGNSRPWTGGGRARRGRWRRRASSRRGWWAARSTSSRTAGGPSGAAGRTPPSRPPAGAERALPELPEGAASARRTTTRRGGRVAPQIWRGLGLNSVLHSILRVRNCHDPSGDGGGSGSEGRRAVAGPWAQPLVGADRPMFRSLAARPLGFGGFYASDPCVGPRFLGLGLPPHSWLACLLARRQTWMERKAAARGPSARRRDPWSSWHGGPVVRPLGRAIYIRPYGPYQIYMELVQPITNWRLILSLHMKQSRILDGQYIIKEATTWSHLGVLRGHSKKISLNLIDIGCILFLKLPTI